MSALDLDAITANEVKTTGVSSTMELPINEVYPNPYQPRKIFDEQKLQELSDSIVTHGLMQPVVVVQTEKGYMLLAGERRYKAHLLAELKTIKAEIVIKDPKELKESSLVENIQRDDLTDLEVSICITELWESGDYEKKQDLADRLGKKPAYISKALALVDRLDPSIKADIIDQKLDIGLSVLDELSRVKETEIQKTLYQQLKNKEIKREHITTKRNEILNDLKVDGEIKVNETISFEYSAITCNFLRTINQEWIIKKLESKELYSLNIKEVSQYSNKITNDMAEISFILQGSQVIKSAFKMVFDGYNGKLNKMITIGKYYKLTLKPTGNTKILMFKNHHYEEPQEDSNDSNDEIVDTYFSRGIDKCIIGSSTGSIHTLLLTNSSKYIPDIELHTNANVANEVKHLLNTKDKYRLDITKVTQEDIDLTDRLYDKIEKLEKEIKELKSKEHKQNENAISFTDIDYTTLLDFTGSFMTSMLQAGLIDEDIQEQVRSHYNNLASKTFKITIEETE